MGDRMVSLASNLMNVVCLLGQSGFITRELKLPTYSASNHINDTHRIEIRCLATEFRVVMESQQSCQCASTTSNSIPLKMLWTPCCTHSPRENVEARTTISSALLDKPTIVTPPTPQAGYSDTKHAVQPSEFVKTNDEDVKDKLDYPPRPSFSGGAALSKIRHSTSTPSKVVSRLFDDSGLSSILEENTPEKSIKRGERNFPESKTTKDTNVKTETTRGRVAPVSKQGFSYLKKSEEKYGRYIPQKHRVSAVSKQEGTSLVASGMHGHKSPVLSLNKNTLASASPSHNVQIVPILSKNPVTTNLRTGARTTEGITAPSKTASSTTVVAEIPTIPTKQVAANSDANGMAAVPSMSKRKGTSDNERATLPLTKTLSYGQTKPLTSRNKYNFRTIRQTQAPENEQKRRFFHGKPNNGMRPT